jgi:hypothetical protein
MRTNGSASQIPAICQCQPPRDCRPKAKMALGLTDLWSELCHTSLERPVLSVAIISQTALRSGGSRVFSFIPHPSRRCTHIFFVPGKFAAGGALLLFYGRCGDNLSLRSYDSFNPTKLAKLLSLDGKSHLLLLPPFIYDAVFLSVYTWFWQN